MNKHEEAESPSAAKEVLSISGIYPHLAAWNHGTDSASPWYQQPECGIGAVVPWAGRLWFLTYTSHALHHSDDKLYAVLPDKSIVTMPESVGGTHAARMIHSESNQLFIGCYAIDAQGKVRVIDRDKMPGRLTAVTRHLVDPANKIYFYTQECSLYEVDVHTLEPTLLFIKPLPGWHAKGAYASQGVLVVAHNGEQPADAPFWKVDYRNLPPTVREVEKYLQTPISYGDEDWGVLGEWDGTHWKVISRRQHNDVNGPGGLTGRAADDEPIWAQGWDRRSAILNVRAAGRWKTYRVPKGSYTYDGWNGSYTEWPRFREVGDGRWLLTLHGTFFEWSADFRPGRAAGVRPICTCQRYIPDFCRWGTELVLAGQDASRIGVPWAAPGHAHSNLQFIDPDVLQTWGPRSGFGGVWRDDPVEADAPSDPFLVAGYDSICMHLTHDRQEPVDFIIEADPHGTDEWQELSRLTVPRHHVEIVRPPDLGATWIRLRTRQACRTTVYFHLCSERAVTEGEDAIFQGLAPADGSGQWSGGTLRVPKHNHNLSFLAYRAEAGGGQSEELYYEIDERLAFHPIVAPEQERELRETSAIQAHVFEDSASLVVINADGRRLRLPRSPHVNVLVAQRDVREVLQERSLANLGGTFYEVPRSGGAEPYEWHNMPDYSRMRPIASHRALITDFCIWRGMLVLAGVRDDTQEDGHVFRASGGGPALWFGAIDDLWKLGRPIGVGGPWMDIPVRGDEPSDLYLMTGFDRKTLRLAHRSRQTVRFRIEVDATADGAFNHYDEFDVASGETFKHTFPDGFQAHWLRVVPLRSTVATAQLNYE
ncbi:MAG TPA: hypothetical protein VK324_11155 [Tepidisphaeraceae bacterium]|nr:hypothetical protein [Tepidisphaeraceae bacterium]